MTSDDTETPKGTPLTPFTRAMDNVGEPEHGESGSRVPNAWETADLKARQKGNDLKGAVRLSFAGGSESTILLSPLVSIPFF